MEVPREEFFSRIPQFFAGRAVFITGATGFMGKVLIERLLSTCPDIGRLHLLVRDKAWAKPEDRLLALKRSQVFDVLRMRSPSQLDKLRLVCGDISRPGLDITAADALAELQEVSVVFHVAASVRFDEPLRRAAEVNVLSVSHMLDFADQLPRMQAFVHVSTAYTNLERPTIAECLYPLPSDLSSMLANALAQPDHTPKEQVERIISPKPNTYIYTKSMGEAMAAERSRAYPIAIFRPTMLTSSLRHPFPGWIDGHNGTGGGLAAICSGYLHTIRCKKWLRADLLPVDIATDTLIAVAWETAIDNSKEVKVYTCSTNDNPTTWEELCGTAVTTARQHPWTTRFSYPSCVLTDNRFVYETLKLFTQTIPLHMAENVSKIFDKRKSRINLINVNSRLDKMHKVFQFFTSNEWTFCTDNVRHLRGRLSRADAAVFNLDPGTIDWKNYHKQFARGCCLYLVRNK